MAGFTVSVDNADGQGSVPDAAVLLAATAWGRVRRRRRRRRCGRVAWVRGVGGRPAGIRVHRASGLSLRGPRGRAAGGEV